MTETAELKKDKLSEDDTIRWYKVPWVWFIVGTIVVSFAWGIFQVYIAFTNVDAEVIDDYYIEGKAVNLALQRDRLAKALNIEADVNINQGNNKITVNITGDLSVKPKKILLSFLAPIRKNLDQKIVLELMPSGLYVAPMTKEISGSYYVQLEPVLPDESTAVPLTPDEQSQSKEELNGNDAMYGWRLNTETKIIANQPFTISNDG